MPAWALGSRAADQKGICQWRVGRCLRVLLPHSRRAPLGLPVPEAAAAPVAESIRAGFAKVVARAGLVPSDALAVFVSGSLLEGWAHPNSDLDVFVITPTALPAETMDAFKYQTLEERVVGIRLLFDDDRRWDFEYWTEGQIEEILAKVSGWRYTPVASEPPALSDGERDIIWRLAIAESLQSEVWLTSVQDRFQESDLYRLIALLALNDADGLIDDVAGLLEIGAQTSAVMAARQALDRVADGVAALYGELSVSAKWRAARLQRANPEELPFSDYWRQVTFTSFDQKHPAEWARESVALCQSVLLGLDLDTAGAEARARRYATESAKEVIR